MKVITPPSAVISTADAKLALRIDNSAEDSLVASNILSAMEWAQQYTGVAMGQQTVEIALDAFPDDYIELKLAPVTSITSVTYVDTAGATQTLSNSVYELDDYGLVHLIRLKYGQTWPSTRDTANAVKVRYVVGETTPKPSARAGILLLVGHLMENRQEVTDLKLAQIPVGAASFLDYLKTW